MVAVFACAATVLAISATLAVFKAQATLERAINERPVMVVPGAVAGEYISGLSEENLKGVARYVGQLGSSFTPSNFRVRMDELLTYADVSYQPTLGNETKQLESEVVAQAQGRFFMPDTGTERFTVLGPNLFEYSAKGPWSFMAGGLALSQDQGEVIVKFKLGQPDQRNKYGFKIIKFTAIRTKGGA